MKLLYEDVSSTNAFDVSNPGRYVKEFLYDEKVGKVSAHDYKKFEKLLDGNIEYMTGNEYIRHCIDDIFGSSYDQVVTKAVDKDKVQEYADLMRSGTTFPICYLDYVYHQQEGRHRALAFREAFGDAAKMPVLVIQKTSESTPIEEIWDYCERRWGNNADFFFNTIAQNIGKSEYEINTFLGKETEQEPDEDFYVDDDEIEDIIGNMELDDLIDL